jgi:membrane associated rhomboid family serine protease
MIPIGDENRIDRAPVASRTIILTCCVVFLWQVSPYSWGPLASMALGFTPAYFFAGGPGNPLLDLVPYAVTMVTYAFLHGSWIHLLGNMLFLWIFGDDVEDLLGHPTFIVFYLMAGMAAALAHAGPDPHSTTPIIGASGAISGVLGAYLVWFPRAQIKVLVPIFIVVDVVRLPAWMVLAFWFAVQLAYEFAGPGLGGNIAFRAHIGGFLFGMVAAPIFVRVIGARSRPVAGQPERLLR